MKPDRKDEYLAFQSKLIRRACVNAITSAAVVVGLYLFVWKQRMGDWIYHLWYLPALLLGTPIAYYLSRFKPQAAIPIAGALYLIGLGGESYYGLVSGIPVLSTFYNGIFQVFDYTRNGLFYVPLFLLLGAAGIVFSRRTSVIGLLCSLAALIVEALLLHRSGIQRHDSMYFFFPFLMVFLFSLLLEANQGERRNLRQLTTVVYLIHPWCIVLVRGAAKVIGLTGLLVENTVVLAGLAVYPADEV